MLKHRFIVAKLVSDNVVLQVTRCLLILYIISFPLWYLEVTALSQSGFVERGIFVLITLIVVIVMDDYNVERKILKLATAEHTMFHRTLLTRIKFGRILSISLETVDVVPPILVNRVSGIIRSPTFALTVDFALFGETHASVFACSLINIFVLALLQNVDITSPFKSRKTFTQINVIIFIFPPKFDEQLLSTGDPIKWSADHAEFGEALKIEEIGYSEHTLKISHNWMPLWVIDYSLRCNFTKSRWFWAETSTEGKRRRFLYRLRILISTLTFD